MSGNIRPRPVITALRSVKLSLGNTGSDRIRRVVVLVPGRLFGRQFRNRHMGRRRSGSGQHIT